MSKGVYDIHIEILLHLLLRTGVFIYSDKLPTAQKCSEIHDEEHL